MITPLQKFNLKWGLLATAILLSGSLLAGNLIALETDRHVVGKTSLTDNGELAKGYNLIDNNDCPDCFSSELISTSETENGCTTYVVEVSNDGNCRHALSHYSVNVPCGEVSNISNSRNWKVEIGKDPTTGLNGFKVDDIDGFGEANDPGKFQVEFTVCRNNSDCTSGQDCWDFDIAHKAGQCITTESLALCTNNPGTSENQDPDTNHDNTDCLASAAKGHAVWIQGYLNGKNGEFMFDSNGGSVKQFADGTGHITGTVALPDHPNDQWEVDVWMSDRKNWQEWSATGGGWKGDKNIVGDSYKDWSYYLMDPTKDNRLIGKGKNEGMVLYLSHYPAGYEYAMQVGKAANDKNGNYGLSIWFTYEKDGKLFRGDFNFDLSCEVVEAPEEECDVNELAARLNASDVTCANAQDGSIAVEIIGGVAPFTFAWSNGAATQDISALAGGNYSVTITDADEATLQLSANVFEPAALEVMGAISPMSCGATNGSIMLTVNGGTAPYSYSWSNGSTDKDLSGLEAGAYSVDVTDANGCSVSKDFTLLATSGLTATISSNSCNDGSLTLDLVGGVPPYSYAWSTGETTKDIKVSATGTYEVMVTDVNNCSATASIEVSDLTTFDLSVQTTTPTCAGNADGVIDLSIDGGVGPFTYSWSNGATTQDLNNVVSGNYTVTVTDSRGCVQELTHFLRNPVGIFISEKVDLIRCDGNGADGAIDISIFNAAAPFTTIWTKDGVPYSTVEDLSDLEPGVYSLAVTDNNGCQATKVIELVAPEDIQVDLTQQYCGDGRICPTISGGNGSFGYQWTGPSGSITTIDGCIEVTEAGDYTVIVTDDNGCTKTATINIGAPNPSLTTSVNTNNPSCKGAANGSANLSVSGGDGSYTIVWGGPTPIANGTLNATGLSAGTYTVRVTDGNDCQQYRVFNLQDPEGIVITAAGITEVSCNGESDGSVNISVLNGTAPYTYEWSNGSTSQNLASVGVGIYTVTVTDAAGCSNTMNFEVSVNPDSTGCDDGNGDGGDPGNGDGNGDGTGDGNGDGNQDPCIRDCNTCDGEVEQLTLIYTGELQDAQIKVEQKNGGAVVFDGIVAPNGEFSFTGSSLDGTLTSEIIISVNGGEQTTIHTSCSEPIGPGLIAGNFEVVAGESRNGGPLCPVEPGTEQQEEEDPVKEEEPVAAEGQDCAECHDTQVISISETDQGCITYTLEVSNNGACAHGLSHFSVRVPCGIVTDASNSRGWKMELNGKDPSTNLYGLKVDDIHGFGEDGESGSFTVTYTVCPNDNQECVTKLKSDDIIVGYKAAQCAKIETIQANDQLANLDLESQMTDLTFVKFSVYPNPVEANRSNGLKLKFEEANLGEQLNVKIVDATGRGIFTERVEITGANQVVPLKTAGLTPGMYYVTITSHHKVYSEKVIIK